MGYVIYVLLLMLMAFADQQTGSEEQTIQSWDACVWCWMPVTSEKLNEPYLYSNQKT